MSDPEQFLSRWSRRKREAADDPAAHAEESGPVDNVPPRDEAQPASTDAPPPFDPASLPPIESITANSDIRAFFSPGVPADLVRAALRRVWTSDPAIRDFVGLSENAWDFTAPDGVPGFGPLEMTSELRQLVSQSLNETARALEAAGSDSPEPVQPAESAQFSDKTPAANRPHAATVEQTKADQTSGTTGKTDKEAAAVDPTSLPKVDIALQHKSDAPQYTELPTRRAHGRALPE